ncbi:MAG: hypothetical protein IPK20_19840 [Betaproteobacteria bacterium]|nr:hypothetical protein [Betaproteobacteria bacterium]
MKHLKPAKSTQRIDFPARIALRRICLLSGGGGSGGVRAARIAAVGLAPAARSPKSV